MSSMNKQYMKDSQIRQLKEEIDSQQVIACRRDQKVALGEANDFPCARGAIHDARAPMR